MECGCDEGSAGRHGRAEWRVVHFVKEEREKVVCVVRSGRRLRMILDAKDRACLVAKPFDRPVIQIGVGNFDVIRYRGGINRKPMVLRRDFDLSRVKILDRMIAAPMTKLQFVGGRAHRLSEYLMPEANAKGRDARIDQSPRVVDGVVERRRISGTVAQKHPVRAGKLAPGD